VTVDALLSRLKGVRRTSHDRWRARCPAHDDRHPSLSIREVDDGRVLVHDFAGCSVEEILSAVRLDFDALFPKKPFGNRVKRERRPFNAYDVLDCISFEALIASIAASTLARGEALSEADRERLRVASLRFACAAEISRA
jgi:hypothetical protein